MGAYPEKPEHAVLGGLFRSDLITVKFRDGLTVRLRDGVLTDLGTGALKDAGAVLGVVTGGGAAGGAGGGKDGGRWERAHENVSEELLAGFRKTAEANLGRPVADLNLQFHLLLPPGVGAEGAIDALNGLACVEMAEGVPLPVRAPTPPNYQARQGYLGAAPAGMAFTEVSSWIGGAGAGVRVVDLEYSWNLAHQDLATATRLGPAGLDPFADTNHGTAVLGEMIGLGNGWGVTGAAPGVTPHVVPTVSVGGTWNIGGAITTALATLRAGDVILIEQQMGGPLAVAGDPTQFGLVPIEWYRPWYNAIVTAVGNGVTVVEAAGNGQQSLDAAVYGTGNGGHWPFTAAMDSGAIIVGAGGAPGTTTADRTVEWYSNSGTTVDLQGWGEGVATAGYGDLYSAEGVNRWYTADFGGTSSASPMVAGAAAQMQAVAKAATGSFLTPAALTALLRSTGSAQTGGLTRPIGPRPNVAAALRSLLGPSDCNGNGVPDPAEHAAPSIVFAPAPVSAAAGGTAAFTVTATGGGPGAGTLSYRWRRGGEPLVDGTRIAGSAQSMLTLSGVSAADAGVYDVAVTTGCGTTVSAGALLTVTGGCPADFDGSGEVNANDVSAFINAWYGDIVGGTTDADFDASGETDANYISSFINGWYTAVVNGGAC